MNKTITKQLSAEDIDALNIRSFSIPSAVISNAKAIISGRHIELAISSRANSTRFIHAKRPRRERQASDWHSDATEPRALSVPLPEAHEGVALAPTKRRRDNLQRTRMNLMRKARTCHTKNTRFVTFTLADNSVTREQMIAYFYDTVRTMQKALYRNIDYLYVLERQKERGLKEGNLGAWHIHALFFNVPYFTNESWHVLFWNHGWVKATTVHTPEACGFYMSKYFGKDFDNLAGNLRSYTVSKFLRKSIELRTEFTIRHVLMQALDRGYLLKQNGTYENPYTGNKVTYYDVFPPV